MPKEIKGNAGRKPPEPTTDHSAIDDWLGQLVPRLQPIVRALDETIRSELPGVQFGLKWKRPYYYLPDLGWLIELAPYDVSVNIVFLGGAGFESPPPLGTVGRSRYIKITSLDEAQSPQLRKWITSAGRTPGWL
jgi:hypothetical protein